MNKARKALENYELTKTENEYFKNIGKKTETITQELAKAYKRSGELNTYQRTHATMPENLKTEKEATDKRIRVLKAEYEAVNDSRKYYTDTYQAKRKHCDEARTIWEKAKTEQDKTDASLTLARDSGTFEEIITSERADHEARKALETAEAEYKAAEEAIRFADDPVFELANSAIKETVTETRKKLISALSEALDIVNAGYSEVGEIITLRDEKDPLGRRIVTPEAVSMDYMYYEPFTTMRRNVEALKRSIGE